MSLRKVVTGHFGGLTVETVTSTCYGCISGCLSGQFEALLQLLEPHLRRQIRSYLARPTDWQQIPALHLVCQTMLGGRKHRK